MTRNYIRGEGSAGWWAPIILFLGHTIAGTLIFIIIGLPAIGIFFLVKRFKEIGVGEYTITVLTALENAILTIDALLLFVYVVVTGIIAARGIVRALRE